jgi:hypothetical protein
VGEEHLHLLPTPASLVKLWCYGESPSHVAGVFVEVTRDFSSRRIGTAPHLEVAGITVLLAGAIETCSLAGDACPWRRVCSMELNQLLAYVG